MSIRTAYIISAIIVLCGLTFGIIDACTIHDTETAKILTGCGINPMNGAWLK